MFLLILTKADSFSLYLNMLTQLKIYQYLHDPDKDVDIHFDFRAYEPPQHIDVWGPRPYYLAEIIYEYDTDDEGRRSCTREADDHFFESHTHPLHQYTVYRADGGSLEQTMQRDSNDAVIYGPAPYQQQNLLEPAAIQLRSPPLHLRRTHR